ncbi:TPA: hypothetical protein N0F65_002841 [Lagenidium giganteum]|uniref:EF-hand domain-containing protein n=1 Tax=Lagenidium giganteum TaxID=4803 RepID=A0AAV2Z7N7_9STRA|nr:TPA: hypothetical protein N0F65_002841 [Lagenidium giganteum]
MGGVKLANVSAAEHIHGHEREGSSARALEVAHCVEGAVTTDSHAAEFERLASDPMAPEVAASRQTMDAVSASHGPSSADCEEARMTAPEKAVGEAQSMAVTTTTTEASKPFPASDVHWSSGAPAEVEENGAMEPAGASMEEAMATNAVEATDVEMAVPIAEPSDLSAEERVDEKAKVTQRKRKRSKRLGFSSNKQRNGKRHSGNKAAKAAAVEEEERADDGQREGSDEWREPPGSPLLGGTPCLYPSSNNEEPWEWESCDVYFDAVTDEHMDELAQVQESCANVVAANAETCALLRHPSGKDTVMHAMIAQATDSTSARVTPVRRGRYYRDVWEEEDFLHREERLQAQSLRRKRPFAGEPVLRSNRSLVLGYDDDLFRAFIAQLEAQVNSLDRSVECEDVDGPVAEKKEVNEDTRPTTKRERLKNGSNMLLHDVLPPLPSAILHPAACGSSTAPSNDEAFECVHPASVAREIGTPRWKEEHDIVRHHATINVDDNSESTDATEDEMKDVDAQALADHYPLPSYGTAIEEDEVFREIQVATAQLLQVSMTCWRQAVVLGERAEAYRQVSQIEEMKAASERKLEKLFQQLYPPPSKPAPPGEDAEIIRPMVLRSKPSHLISYSTWELEDAEADALSVSVEFATKLRVGEIVDVLDQYGCWNDGVVVDTYSENSRTVKYVLTRLSLWPEHAMEWIPVTHGRFLPRGISSGKRTLTAAMRRGKKRSVPCNQKLALTLSKLLLHTTLSPMAQQRKNFRCPRDLTANGSAPHNAGLVVSHSELPPRQRKRLQVGSTNLSKSSSTPALLLAKAAHDLTSPLGSHCKHVEPAADISAVIQHLSETSIDLVKASSHASASLSVRNMKQEIERASTSYAIQTEQRRLRSMTPSGSEGRLRQLHTSAGPRSRDEHVSAAISPLAVEVTEANEVIENQGQVSGQHARQAWSNQHSLEAQLKRSATLRRKLHDAFMQKYGSMRAVFRAFDNDGNGIISFQRFQDMVDAAEVDITPDEARTVYQQVDTNGNNAIEFQEFAQMFTEPVSDGAASPFSPLREDPYAQDPSSSFALKFRTTLQLTPRSRDRMKELRDKVTGQLAKKHGLEVNMHGGKNEKLLIYAFKQFDLNNDGLLSYEQVKNALGKEYLQLDINPHEMEEMLRMIDRNGDEQISMKEFVQYFGVGKREVATDMLDEGRKKELAALHAKFTAPFTPRAEVDPEYYQRKPPSPAPVVLPTLEPGGCLQENLIQRVAASPMFKTRPTLSTPKASIRASATKDKQDDKNANLGPEVNPIVAVSQDRFRFHRLERTDWNRVGVGGDGVRPDTALYMGPTDRFKTTSNEVYSPLKRGMNSWELCRDDKSRSTIEYEEQQQARVARNNRTVALIKQMEANRIKEERLKDWKARAKARSYAQERYHYLDHVQEQEQKVMLKEAQMQKRHGGSSFLHMWAGSAESQFNDTKLHSPVGAPYSLSKP